MGRREDLLRLRDAVRGQCVEVSRGTTRVFDPPIPVDDKHRFAIDDVSLMEALHVHGRLRANAANGTLEFNAPAFTSQEDLQGVQLR